MLAEAVATLLTTCGILHSGFRLCVRNVNACLKLVLRAPQDVVDSDDAAAPHEAQQLLKVARIAALVCICRPQRSIK